MNFIKILKKADVIIGTLEIKTHLLAILIGLLTRKPVILWLHKDLKPFLKGKNIFQRSIYLLLFHFNIKYTKKIVCVSNGVANNLISIFPKYKYKIKCIYNPQNFNKFEKDSYIIKGINPSWIANPFVLAIGRMTYQKGFDILLYAFSKITKYYPSINLIILGNGKDRKKLKQLSQTLGIASKVYMPGFMNPHYLMKHALLFVLSSRFEGLCNVLIEAMYHEMHIISTNCPSGPYEILDGGKYGVLIECNNITELASNLLKELKTINSSRFLDLHKSEKRLYVQKFSFREIIPQWEEIISEIK